MFGSSTQDLRQALPDTNANPGMQVGHAVAQQAVLVVSEAVPSGTPEVNGFNFNDVHGDLVPPLKKPTVFGQTPAPTPEEMAAAAAAAPARATAAAGGGATNMDALFAAYRTTGLQATNLALAVDRVNAMLSWRGRVDANNVLVEPHELSGADKKLDAAGGPTTEVECTRFLGFTSNMVSSGIRETIRYLCQHKLVDCIVTTGGAIEEDLMKTMNPTYVGSFDLPGRAMRLKGQNRLANMIVPNNNYRDFEDWINPILTDMLKEQKEDGVSWTPSKMIARFGEEIDDERSVWYWCWKNDIPVFCPAITDGSIGDMVYFHSFNNPGLVIDIAADIRRINDIACAAKKTGMIILGGGVVKHHICNANLMRNGADFSVFINTGQEFDGSDSGARPDEAISWGKCKIDSEPVKVYADASLVFPLLVSQSFVKYNHQRLKIAHHTALAMQQIAAAQGQSGGGGFFGLK